MWMSVGNTRSRKVVYAATRLESIAELFDGPHLNFTVNDLFDTYAIYQYRIERSLARDQDVDLMENHCNWIVKAVGLDELWEIARDLKLETVFDICNFGRSLVRFEFREDDR